ncbi:thiolase family protein [Blastochloris sulfoviridis]|uniref:Thiolase family protein n=1 Tax=Blastochloris sulfoviridis TaxID=50712 RepID=A0A5M6I1M5_9HYPH|nr:thiolase family protein [Blastochloris sulfoviridis]KAA5601718.1 thiolase family protein [Blastochloris sulfoviridis]
MNAVIVAARRTAVAPRGGAFARIEPHDLASRVIEEVLADAGLAPDAVEDVILGNALYGGGNPARRAALAAGIRETVPALTVDSQCCAGLDAILLAAERINAGAADVIVAGGVESFSRAPIRQRRPREPGEAPLAYDRPPFTPWPERDPDMIPAAAVLAAELGISRAAQEAFAVESHLKGRGGSATGEIVAVEGLARDAFTRALTPAIAARLKSLAGEGAHAVTAATVAVEADAAAVVLVVSERRLEGLGAPGRPLRILAGARRGGDPTRPGLAPIEAAKAALERAGHAAGGLAAAEIMEAFAVQAMACIDGIGLDRACVNRSGGALSRGHPIGASGAILMVRLWHELQREAGGSAGLAAIAAAGGLGSALVGEV